MFPILLFSTPLVFVGDDPHGDSGDGQRGIIWMGGWVGGWVVFMSEGGVQNVQCSDVVNVKNYYLIFFFFKKKLR